MKSLLLTQFYQLKKISLWQKCFVVLLVFNFALLILGILNGQTVSQALVSGNGFVLYGCQFPGMFVFMAISELVGRDYQDRTISQHLATGHTRGQIFSSYIIFGSLIGVLGGLLLLLIPVVVLDVFCEWGNAVTFEAVVGRMLLTFFPMLRLACVANFLCYLFRNSYTTMAVGCIGIYIEVIIGLETEVKEPFFMSMRTLNQIFTMHLGDAGSSLDVGLLRNTIGYSLVFVIIFLLAGYWNLKKDDMR